MMQNYFYNDTIQSEELKDGAKRKILAYHDHMMLVEGFYKSGNIGPMHSHIHEQITYVVDGEFIFTVGDETKHIKKGDSIYIEPNQKHGFKCIIEGKLIDVFSPKREDFLK